MWIYHSLLIQLMSIWVTFTVLYNASVHSHFQVFYEHIFVSLGTILLCGISGHMVTVAF